jgi:uncharacterized circularly permuted ATP-grasp superfamily protein/uncharacterized alpha-E superfamily protein
MPSIDADLPPSSVRDAAAPWRPLAGYRAEQGVYDEMVGPGGVRPHCEPFVRSLEAIGRPAVGARWELAKRTIRDNGVTYNVYGDPQGEDRPWALDLMPFVVAPDEWARLEAGVVQRARLLNAMLADLYGPQRLLHSRRLPPEVVLRNPAFLRPCHGLAAPGGVHLHLHAVDLARAPDGEWIVLADRTQAPSGAGYALENRIVLSRTLPEAFRDCHVQRLAPFFRAHRDWLNGLARRDAPRVVLLTPGPLNETYFEHAYLARYLGFTLVEGGDLTVRDRRVFIKTLEGLQPVDVIVRRLDDSYCDPLELRAESTLGVPGLIDAVRSGSVVVANALGSGVVETPALSPFLPGLARELLGEALALASVPTRWCGTPAARQDTLAHLDRLVVKRTLTPSQRPPVFGRLLTAEQRALLAREIEARPHEFVAQDDVALSRVPTWTGQEMVPRALVLRMYVAAAGETFVVMPGGLTRVAGSPDAVVSMQRGGGSKDTWVTADGPVSPLTLLEQKPVVIRRDRRSGDLPSRVADHLFWLGRHAERAEHTVRLLRALVSCLADEDTTADTPELAGLIHTLAALDLVPQRLCQPLPLRALERELLPLLFSESPLAAGLHRTLPEVLRNAAAVRDRLSTDTWRILNQLRYDVRLGHGPIQLNDVLLHLNRMIVDLAAFSGMEMENMTRGHGWRFLDIGRRLERSADMAHLLLAVVTATPSPAAMLGPLLDIADSAMTYRRRYFARPQLAPVLDLLVADGSNTRAIAFQVPVLTEHVTLLPRDPKAPSPTREQVQVAHVAALLADADLDALSQADADGQYVRLAGVLREIDDELRALSDTITHYYFSHAEPRVS